VNLLLLPKFDRPDRSAKRQSREEEEEASKILVSQKSDSSVDFNT
jgi:hypothetical protein